MKKFLIPFMLAVAILIPTAIVEAADVPSFYQIGGSYLTLTERADTEKGYRFYAYDCNIDLNEEFAEQFIKNLVNDYNFRLAAHFINDYREDQSALYDTWILIYKGSKKISLFDTINYDNMQTYKGNLSIYRKKDWANKTTTFWIYIANGLTYEDD